MKKIFETPTIEVVKLQEIESLANNDMEGGDEGSFGGGVGEWDD